MPLPGAASLATCQHRPRRNPGLFCNPGLLASYLNHDSVKVNSIILRFFMIFVIYDHLGDCK